MKTISKLFAEQFEQKIKKDWEVLYVVVDWHETLMPASYMKRNRFGDYPYYPYALEALAMMSDRADIRLILYTSSYQTYYQYLLDDLKKLGINFFSVNGNPNEKNTETGDFSIKFYYSILLDDKAGFEPETDWKEIIEVLGKHPIYCGTFFK